MFLCFCINQIILLHVIIKHAHGTGWEWTFSKSKSMQICMYTVYSICAVFVYVILELRVLEISDTFICTGNIFAMINESIKLSCVNCRQLSQFFPDDWCYKKIMRCCKEKRCCAVPLNQWQHLKSPPLVLHFLFFGVNIFMSQFYSATRSSWFQFKVLFLVETTTGRDPQQIKDSFATVFLLGELRRPSR